MKLALLSAGLLVAALTGSANAAADHWDRFSCYAYVHDQCFGGGEVKCDDATYDWGLDQCDGYYPSGAVKRPAGLTGQPAKRVLQSTKTLISNSFN